jgi:ketol-acid reductoisomerase
MTPDGRDRLELLRNVMDAFNRHDVEAILSFFAEDCVFQAARGSEPGGRRVEGKANVREAFTARFAEMPDVSYTDDAHFVSGNRGLSEWTTSGTTENGDRMVVRGCDLWTFDDGGKITRKDSFWKIVEPAATAPDALRAEGAAQGAFSSDVFPVEDLELDGRVESIVRGSRSLFARLGEAFEGVQRIAILGWGPQGRAQALNLRESLEGSGITVGVGLREGSASFDSAREEGFSEQHGTLGEMFAMAAEADMVVALIADAAQAALYPRLFATIKSGATLGLSHGFLLGHLEERGDRFPEDIDVIAVCPKGMGASVRRLYEQGRDLDGAGINTSFAVHQDVTGRATERALGWSIALGAPCTFMTDLRSEYVSDLVGERAILLGAPHGIVEALYRRFSVTMSEEDAFVAACESMTGPIARTISHDGMLGLYESLDPSGRSEFERAYSSMYGPAKELLEELYDEVESGNEIRSVILSSNRLSQRPMSTIDDSRMWSVGASVRAERDRRPEPAVHPLTAGIYCATMMAQVDTLLERGHSYSEIANESIIEAVDSLLPYCHARGIAYMVDNCSTTARLGTRKWGPRFEAQLNQVALPSLDAGTPLDEALLRDFKAHAIHGVLKAISTTRPSVDIAVV